MKLGIVLLSLVFSTFSTFPTANVGQATSAQAPDATKELAKLSGSWLILSFNGQDVPADAEAYLEIQGDQYVQWMGEQRLESGTIKIDVTTKPWKIDMTIKEGSDAGKQQLGLYELTGDTLTLGMGTPGATSHPQSMKHADIYGVLKRVK